MSSLLVGDERLNDDAFAPRTPPDEPPLLPLYDDVPSNDESDADTSPSVSEVTLAQQQRVESEEAQTRQTEIIHYNIALRHERGCEGHSVLISSASQRHAQPLVWTGVVQPDMPSRLLAPLFPTVYPLQAHWPLRRVLLDDLLSAEEVAHFVHTAGCDAFATVDLIDGGDSLDGDDEGPSEGMVVYVCEGAPSCPVTGAFDEVSEHEKCCEHVIIARRTAATKEAHVTADCESSDDSDDSSADEKAWDFHADCCAAYHDWSPHFLNAELVRRVREQVRLHFDEERQLYFGGALINRQVRLFYLPLQFSRESC